jgi:serine/threonine protein phosphatase PrpC
MTTKTLTTLLIAALLAGSAAAYADETPIQMAMEDGKTVVQFKVGDSRCLLVDDQIRCTRVGK